MQTYKTTIVPKTLYFRKPAGTSRGVYTERKVWYIVLTDGKRRGTGECAPLPKLSADDLPDYGSVLANECERFEKTGKIDTERLRNFPSILFGLETALLNLKKQSFALWDTPFSRGECGIPINGLIWMGDYNSMLSQIEEKIRLHFMCIKLKIGVIAFKEEWKLLKFIRSRFSSDEIELRVDANGAFGAEDAMEKLEKLSKLDIHSIEQPVKAGQSELMKKLCRESPLPIAFDEELIGIRSREEKYSLLRNLHPRYIVIKPSLHGGIQGTLEWVKAAKDTNTGWWITSALESDIGLNAIAHLCAKLKTGIPQGLGTGMLYTNNVTSSLEIRGDCLWFRPEDKINP